MQKLTPSQAKIKATGKDVYYYMSKGKPCFMYAERGRADIYITQSLKPLLKRKVLKLDYSKRTKVTLKSGKVHTACLVIWDDSEIVKDEGGVDCE